MFEEYAIKGCRFEYIPGNGMGVNQADPNAVIEPVGLVQTAYAYQDINSYNILNYSADQAMMSDSFQMFDPKRSFVINLDNRQLAKSQNCPWKSFPGNVNLSNGLPGASVAFRFQTYNMNSAGGQVLGNIKATWYFTCRGVNPRG